MCRGVGSADESVGELSRHVDRAGLAAVVEDAEDDLVIRDTVDCTGVDFDGQARPSDGKCDLGADELVRR